METDIDFTQFKIDDKSNNDQIKQTIEKIQEFVKEKSIGAWCDYLLFELKLSKKYSEEEFENKLDCFFCNGLQYDEDKVTVVYSSYDGVLSLTPGAFEEWEHESYFNPINCNHVDDFEKHQNSIFGMLEKLRNM